LLGSKRVKYVGTFEGNRRVKVIGYTGTTSGRA